MIVTLGILSCKKEPEAPTYKFEIKSESIEKTRISATITVIYSYPTKPEYVNALLSISNDMSGPTNTQVVLEDTKFVVTFSDLQVNTKYYYQFEYSNGVDIFKTDIKDFTTNDNGEPSVTTSDVSNISSYSAQCGGNIIDDGGYEITARGVCWSTNQNPTIEGSHTSNGTGTGVFVSNITGLEPFTTYYVRAYASNSMSTSYGEPKSFVPGLYDGALNGLYSVSTSKQVMFSKGNLQYNASSDVWRFADKQYDYIASSNSQISSNYSGWIDLFGWATSGYNHGAGCYQPWSSSVNQYSYYAYGNYTNNLYDMDGTADWGYNVISNGGNEINQWRTLTRNEWEYILNVRNTNSGIRYAMACVNEVNGVILLPDNWNESTYALTNTNNSNGHYNDNEINLSDWISNFETNGVVFLPEAGYRWETSYNNSGTKSCYWSASSSGESMWACGFAFDDGSLMVSNRAERYLGYSVRLIKDAE